MTDAVTDADPRSLDDPPARPIFLLTDFGLRDTYVGQMRAVIAGIAPDAPVHDVVHELPPQDLGAGASALEEIGPWLPPGAIVCAVVDPGVGTAREPIAARLRREDGSTLAAVAPDNGLRRRLRASRPERRCASLAPPAIPTAWYAWRGPRRCRFRRTPPRPRTQHPIGPRRTPPPVAGAAK